MTTIAVNREMMVADSKVTMEAKTQDRVYQAQKLWVTKKGDIIGCAGPNEEIEAFIRWYGSRKKKPRFQELEAVVLTKKGEIIAYDETLAKDTITGLFYAIGSGGQAALGAMEAGASITQAIEIACRVDPSSGLPVQIIRRTCEYQYTSSDHSPDSTIHPVPSGTSSLT